MLVKCRTINLFYFMAISLAVAIVTYIETRHMKNYLKNNCETIEQIDAVYTWVNGSDPKFLINLKKYLIKNISSNTDYSNQRYDDKYELKFSLRSLEKYAPWIRHVYIVTNGQIPYWLNLDYERVSIVNHDEIFIDKNNLPSFSSPAIESFLHRIPGVSKRFIYFNDDIFLGDNVYIEDFYSHSRGYSIYLAYPLPTCAPDCPWMYVSDGQCDSACQNVDCQMDGGDCNYKTIENHSTIITTSDSLSNRLFNYSLNNLTNIVLEHNRIIMRADRLSRKKRKYSPQGNSTFLRKLHQSSVDAYGASLQHTNRCVNIKYKFAPRQVPAHAPILIDVEVMEKLQKKFDDEFKKTARNRIRSGNDMQIAFSYYYFLINEKEKRSVEEIFDMFDTDASGTWSDREIRTVLTKLYELPLSYAIVDHFELLLQNCSNEKNSVAVITPEYERYIDSKLPTISKNLLVECKILADVLIERFGTIPKYKYHILKNAHSRHVIFKMLNSNVSDIVSQLDEIRRETRKFVCLNDNLDDAKITENDLIKSVLYDFYISLFPKPSSFELPPDYRNRFLHTDELNAWKSYNFKINLFIYFLFIVLIQTILITLCKRKLVCRIMSKIIR